jgi:hypothetical protein
MLYGLSRRFLVSTVFSSWLLLAGSLRADYIIHFSGPIDGSDVIQIQPHQATWNHLYWSFPGAPVSLNGISWTPQSMPTLAFNGAPTHIYMKSKRNCQSDKRRPTDRYPESVPRPLVSPPAIVCQLPRFNSSK